MGSIAFGVFVAVCLFVALPLSDQGALCRPLGGIQLPPQSPLYGMWAPVTWLSYAPTTTDVRYPIIGADLATYVAPRTATPPPLVSDLFDRCASKWRGRPQQVASTSLALAGSYALTSFAYPRFAAAIYRARPGRRALYDFLASIPAFSVSAILLLYVSSARAAEEHGDLAPIGWYWWLLGGEGGLSANQSLHLSYAIYGSLGWWLQDRLQATQLATSLIDALFRRHLARAAPVTRAAVERILEEASSLPGPLGMLIATSIRASVGYIRTAAGACRYVHDAGTRCWRDQRRTPLAAWRLPDGSRCAEGTCGYIHAQLSACWRNPSFPGPVSRPKGGAPAIRRIMIDRGIQALRLGVPGGGCQLCFSDGTAGVPIPHAPPVASHDGVAASSDASDREVAATHWAMSQPPLLCAYPPPAPSLSEESSDLLHRILRALAAHLHNPGVLAAHVASGAPSGDRFYVRHPLRPHRKVHAPPAPTAASPYSPSLDEDVAAPAAEAAEATDADPAASVWPPPAHAARDARIRAAPCSRNMVNALAYGEFGTPLRVIHVRVFDQLDVAAAYLQTELPTASGAEPPSVAGAHTWHHRQRYCAASTSEAAPPSAAGTCTWAEAEAIEAALFADADIPDFADM